MHDFIEKFLENYKLATDRQRKREFWNVEGIIKGKSNQSFKFDLRPIIKNAKGGSFKTKADKMVFMGTSFSVNITAIALRIAASNSIDIEIICAILAPKGLEKFCSAIKNADFQVWALGSSFDSNNNLATRSTLSSKLSKLYSLILDTPSAI